VPGYPRLLGFHARRRHPRQRRRGLLRGLTRYQLINAYGL
jgi:hypothetical protein